jgi:hypothetical protein
MNENSETNKDDREKLDIKEGLRECNEIIKKLFEQQKEIIRKSKEFLEQLEKNKEK